MKQKNNNRILFWAILAALVIAGAVFAFTRKAAKAPTTETLPQSQDQSSPPEASSSLPAATQQTPPTKPEATKPKPAQGTFSPGGESQPEGPNMAIEAVDYDGAGFSPSSIKIKVGDYIFFRNNSKKDFWPASDPHPQHTGYPGFDAKGPVAPGKSFKFQFTKAGSWGYHDHLNPAASGTIIVEAPK